VTTSPRGRTISGKKDCHSFCGSMAPLARKRLKVRSWRLSWVPRTRRSTSAICMLATLLASMMPITNQPLFCSDAHARSAPPARPRGRTVAILCRRMRASVVSFPLRKLLCKILLSVWTETRLSASNRPLFPLPRSCSHGPLPAFSHLLARVSACAPSQPASHAFQNVSGREGLAPAMPIAMQRYKLFICINHAVRSLRPGLGARPGGDASSRQTD
jgi:hypothetical protein